MDGILSIIPKCGGSISRSHVFDAGQLFICHLIDVYYNVRRYLHIWLTLVLCLWLLFMFCSPDMLKTLFSVFAFLIVAPLAVLRIASQRKATEKKSPKKWFPYSFFSRRFGRKRKSVKQHPKKFSPFRFLSFLFSSSFVLCKQVVNLFSLRRNKIRSKNKLAHSSLDSDTNLSCVACWDRPKSILLMPCRHVCLCLECANNLIMDRDSGHCPLCRQTIIDVINVYI